MRYYLSRIRKGDLYEYSSSTFVKHLKRRCFNHLKNLARDLSELGFDLEPYWISKSTFGAVLCDYETDKKGMSLVPSQKALFDLICEDYDYVILSKSLERNLKVYETEEDKLKILIININRYENFVETFKDKFTRIKLFLYKKLSLAQEEIINGWIESRLKPVEKQKVSAEEILEEFSREDIDKLVGVINRLESVKIKKTLSQIGTYEEKLKKFEEMVKNEKTSEKDLQDYLHENLWIIDFKYDKQRYKIKTEFKTLIGNIDIILFPKNLDKKNEVIIELKKANKSLTVEYRKGKAAIASEVGKAISQTIHYIESEKRPYQTIEGTVIIGREDSSKFIKTFNEYLHGLQIKTYLDLIEDSREIIESFKQEDVKKGIESIDSDRLSE